MKNRTVSKLTPAGSSQVFRKNVSPLPLAASITGTWGPGHCRSEGTSRLCPALGGLAAVWTARSSCRRESGPARACGSSAQSAAASTAGRTPRSTQSRSAGSRSAMAYWTGSEKGTQKQCLVFALWLQCSDRASISTWGITSIFCKTGMLCLTELISACLVING